ncbi:MAG TPA: tail fiber domain-containing protein [Chthoniobacterales bacterium]|nr:tail fiber domain-containing protein [Chthoniobacterales bacterium]
MKIIPSALGIGSLALLFGAAHLRAQNVGIGFSNPQSKLTVNGNFALGSGFNGIAPTNGAGIEGALFVGGTLANMTGYPSSGAGTYLFFDPTTGSLYAGAVSGTNWDAVNRGSDNAVFGLNSVVTGARNIVGGSSNSVAGSGDIVGGGGHVIDVNSGANVVEGYNNTGTGLQSSLLVGRNNAASGINNLIGGQGNSNIQTGSGSSIDNLVTGLNNTITNTAYAFIGGQGSTINANANYSFVWGQNASVAAGANNSVVFSDSSAATISNTPNTFVIRSSGGYWFYSSASNVGVHLATGATGWTALSDVRAKENLHDLGYGLDAVLAMKPVVYNYKGNPTSQKALGFTAQAMQKIVPEVVDTPKDSSAMMGIRYTELIPVLAKAIQELKQEKDAKESALEKENAQLRAQEERDRTEIASLKASNEKLAAIAAKVEALEESVSTVQAKVNGVVQTVALGE